MPSRRAKIIAAVAALIATGIGIGISYAIHWFPAQASTQAEETDTLYHVLVIASVPIFVLVTGVIVFSVWQFRMRPRRGAQGRSADPWQHAPGGVLDGDPDRTSAEPDRVLVRRPAQQREEAGARDPGRGHRPAVRLVLSIPSSVTGGTPIDSYQLYVPKGESVMFNLHSKDVIHRVLGPGLPHPGGRRAGHHHALARDPRPGRELPGRLQPPVRSGPQPDALDRARGHAETLPVVAREPARERRRRGRRRRGRRGKPDG